ncbi:hypothetical protein EON63_00800 [archaeon]|nr:MAG: hypothetical protein EON63_00800 [archaeon]
MYISLYLFLMQYGCDRKKGDAVNKSGLRAGIKSLALFMDYFNITNPLVVQQHVFAHGKVRRRA